MRLEIEDELEEIVNKTPYCTSRNQAKFLNCSKNTVLKRLAELGYLLMPNLYSPPPVQPQTEKNLPPEFVTPEHKTTPPTRLSTQTVTQPSWPVLGSLIPSKGLKVDIPCREWEPGMQVTLRTRRTLVQHIQAAGSPLGAFH